MLKKKEAILKLNQLGARGVPFDFYCDFLGEKWSISTEQTFDLEIGWKMSEIRSQKPEVRSRQLAFDKYPISYQKFQSAFKKVVEEINYGNSFLTNLTFQTPIKTKLGLSEIFSAASAKYKLHVPNQFVVFSPETFIKIKGNKIYSFPMKGTIDASLINASEQILSDPKEIAEHVTIVDLIRNDLSLVAKNVNVTKFRYIDSIQTNHKQLLQVSSEIEGELNENWKSQLGHILTSLLPAGSISGAPKPETLRIIQEAENYERNFYTGICGRFDGSSLDTGVMIRFIKKENNQLIYCSGGGITSFSEATKEYQEMVDKVYLPI